MFLRKTPIPWLQLKYQRAQTIAAVLGIAFTTILLFMQIGFRSSFLNTLTDLPSAIRADIFLMNASTVSVLKPSSFSQHRLFQTLAIDGVESIKPLYWAGLLMRDPEGNPDYLRNIVTLGFSPANSPIAVPGVDNNIELLKRADVFLMDDKSRPEFNPIIEQVAQGVRYDIEVRAGANQQRIYIENLFSIGANTTANTHLFTSDVTFWDIFNRDRNRIDVGLITLKEGADPEQVRQAIEDYLPGDVRVLTKSQLLSGERSHYEFNTPIGVIFRFGLFGAIAVGIIILYQILFQIISKYIKDYATLKAIGFSDLKLKFIVLSAAILLAVLGFVPGVMLSWGMYQYISASASLKFEMSPGIVLFVFTTICFICLVSAILAVRKLRDADPADLFG
ncbi:MAG: ABC transporter permease DevC [Rhodospirillaceae bacterium]